MKTIIYLFFAPIKEIENYIFNFQNDNNRRG